MVSDQKIVSTFFIGKGFKSNEFTFCVINFEKKFKEVRITNSGNEYDVKTEKIF